MSLAGAVRGADGQNVAALNRSVGTLWMAGFGTKLTALSAPATSAQRWALGCESLAMKLRNARAPRASASQSAGDADASVPIFKDGDVCVAQRLCLRRAAAPSHTGCSLCTGISMQTLTKTHGRATAARTCWAARALRF
jgi:hypothetical protein